MFKTVSRRDRAWEKKITKTFFQNKYSIARDQSVIHFVRRPCFPFSVSPLCRIQHPLQSHKWTIKTKLRGWDTASEGARERNAAPWCSPPLTASQPVQEKQLTAGVAAGEFKLQFHLLQWNEQNWTLHPPATSCKVLEVFTDHFTHVENSF